MKGLRVVLNFLIVSVIAVGCVACTAYSADPDQKISAPRNQSIPIQGIWKVAGTLEGASLKRNVADQPWQGKRLEFSEAFVLVGNTLLANPHYKIKRVQKEDYVLYGHKSLPEDLGIPEEVEVITITDGEKFFCEILMISDRELILEMDQSRLYLTKISDQVDIALDRDEYSRNFPWEIDPQAESFRSGVLLGLSSPAAESVASTEDTTSYRTLWIASQDRRLQPVLETPGIFFPRKSGFWQMEVLKVTEAGRSEDFLLAHPVVAEANEESTDHQEKKLIKEARITLKRRYLRSGFGTFSEECGQ